MAHRGAESAKVLLREGLSDDSRSAPMPTECSAELFKFAGVGSRSVVAGFDGGAITTDAGALLLGALPGALSIVGGRSKWSIRFRRWLASGYSALRWAMRTSTITTSCGTTR